MTELRAAMDRDKQNVALLERIGDVEARLGNKTEAQRLYDDAFEKSPDRVARKRLRDKKAKL